MLGIEFRRGVCAEITLIIEAAIVSSTPNAPQTVVVVGEAGIGKTVALRSVAFELAQRRILCLWAKKSYGEISGGRFEAVVQILNKAVGKDREVVFFVDDPIGSRVNVDEVERALHSAVFKCVLVVCSRKSEIFGGEVAGKSGTNAQETDCEISVEFTSAEFAALPEYLVKLGIAPTLERARAMMPAPGLRGSRDVLCALWYLLPQTKGAIEDSLIEEYFRLGGVENVISAIAAEARESLGTLKRSYEYVTAVSGLENAALPVEVLVSALKVSYGEWLEHCSGQRPVWGLLYEDTYSGAETYSYRTRNYVVTEVLLRAINYGSIGSSGQFRLLKDLLAACTSSTAPYKSFIFDLLVSKRRIVQARFTLEQAMELYDTALAAYPGELGIVRHHQCLVKRGLGGDPVSVYEELRHLIAVAEDAIVGESDSRGNLHTSAAAALTQAVRDGKVDAQEGADRIFEHIGTAIALDQLSMHTHHVHAVALIKLTSTVRDRDPKASILYLERASRIIDRALLLLGPIASRTARRGTDALMFEGLNDELSMAINGTDAFKAKALEAFEKVRDQSALALWARVALREARLGDRGRDYRKVDVALRDIFSRIEAAKQPPSTELLICRAEMVVSWHLDHGKGPVFWEQFESDVATILKARVHSADVLWIFYLGVAYYNLRKFPEAEICFQRLRSARLEREFLGPIRCFYFGEKGEPQILEGILKGRLGGKRYIFSSSLGADLLVRHGDFEAPTEEVCHFKIGFNFTGALAMHRSTELELPRFRREG